MTKWGQELFFPTNPDLANIVGDMDFDFENLYFWTFWNYKFPGSQISRNLALGQAWAGLGLRWAQHRH